MVSLLVLTGRKRRPTDTTITIVGTVGISLAFAVLTAASVARLAPWVVPGVLLLGLSMGVFNVGGLALMMRMSDPRLAGTFLGMWSLMQLMGRGFSGVLSASIRDAVVLITGGDYALAYGLAFAVEAIGVAVALWFLLRVNVEQFTETVRVRAAEVFAAAAD
jgi:BCD family chlorophyll transporter-like MFS transporter